MLLLKSAAADAINRVSWGCHNSVAKSQLLAAICVHSLERVKRDMHKSHMTFPISHKVKLRFWLEVHIKHFPNKLLL